MYGHYVRQPKKSGHNNEVTISPRWPLRRGFTVSDYYWGKQNHLLYQGICYIEIHYSEFPLYHTLTDESNVAEKSLKLDSVGPRSKSG